MKFYPVEFRQKILDCYYNEPISQRQLAKRFRVALSFVQKLLKQSRETGDIRPRTHRCGRHLKLTQGQILSLGELIEENKDATLAELSELFRERTGIVLSVATVGRMAERLRMTREKKTLHPPEKETERVQKLRQEYWDKIRDVDEEKLISLDEAGSNLSMTRTHARSLKGTRAHGTRPLKKGRNVSTITAITKNKVLATANFLGAVTGIVFEAFMLRQVLPKLWKGAVITIDNCKIHFSEEVNQAVEEKGAKLIYLPPYSPDFAPIENFWSKIKSILRKLKPRTYRELDEALEKAFKQVSEKDLRNWFAHCCYCTSSK
ncbi:IS630 family transposase [Pannus brasiliensis CCIBt3594]|uniref:IS630 family transposase n=1 Tax=Pannus brasiliensis CCIBt3594 TaxID=1427578 RepID=A0AAW9QXT4_9CHRO